MQLWRQRYNVCWFLRSTLSAGLLTGYRGDVTSQDVKDEPRTKAERSFTVCWKGVEHEAAASMLILVSAQTTLNLADIRPPGIAAWSTFFQSGSTRVVVPAASNNTSGSAQNADGDVCHHIPEVSHSRQIGQLHYC